MKDNIILFLILILISSNVYIYVMFYNLNSRVNVLDVNVGNHSAKMIYLDKVTEVVEDCMEFSDFAECKKNYPKYAEMFR